MIIHLKKDIGNERAAEVAKENNAFLIEEENQYVLISSSGQKEVDAKYNDIVLESFVFDNDIQ